MNISTQVKQGILLVRVEGELDMLGADEFRRRVDEALAVSQAKHLLLSLKGVTFVDSSGIGVILGRYKRVTAQGGHMLAANVRPQVAKILEMAGLLKVIKLFGSEADALASL